MPFVALCPQCRTSLQVPDPFLNKPVRCSTCQTIFNALPAGGPPVVQPITAPPAAPDAPANPFDFGGKKRNGDRDFYRRNEFERDVVLPDRSVLILLLGIGALLFFCIPGITWLLQIFTFTLAKTDLRDIARGRRDPSGRTLIKVAIILAFVALGLNVLVTLGLCVARVFKH